MFLLWLRQLPWCGDQSPPSVPLPAKGRSSPINTPVFPPSSFVLWSFAWCYIFFSTDQVLLSSLRALLCLKVYYWCIREERCTPHLSALSPSLLFESWDFNLGHWMSGAALGLTDKMEARPQPPVLIPQARTWDEGVRPCNSDLFFPLLSWVDWKEILKVLIVLERSMRMHKAFCSCAQRIIHKVNHWYLFKDFYKRVFQDEHIGHSLRQWEGLLSEAYLWGECLWQRSLLNLGLRNN